MDVEGDDEENEAEVGEDDEMQIEENEVIDDNEE